MFPGIYRGKILNRKDPNKQLRLKVECAQVFGDISEADLPWAYPGDMGAVLGGGEMGGGGQCRVPDKGAPCWLFFEGGDPRYPVWFPGWAGRTKAKVAKHVYDGDGEPNNQSWTTPRGTTIQLDDRKGKEKIVLRLPEGDVIAVTAKGEIEIAAKKVVKIKGATRVEVTSSGNVEVKSPNVSVYAAKRLDILGGTSVGITSLGPLALRGTPLTLNGIPLPPVSSPSATDMNVSPTNKGQ